MAPAMSSPKLGSKASSDKPFTLVTSPPKSQHTSKLMMLPAELRNRIYGLVLSDVVAYRARRTTTNRKIHCVKAQAPGLLVACKQTHNEATRLFYAQATFLFDEVKHLQAWVRNIGGCSERATLIKNIRISSPAPSHQMMVKSYWEPRTAMWQFSMEASSRLLSAHQKLPMAMRRLGCKVQTDLYLPGLPEIKVLWTQMPVSMVEKFLEEIADDEM